MNKKTLLEIFKMLYFLLLLILIQGESSLATTVETFTSLSNDNISVSKEIGEKTFTKSSSECTLKLTPLHYEIHLETVIDKAVKRKRKRKRNNSKGAKVGSVSAWAKVKVRVSDSNCNVNGHTIILDPKECSVDLENIQITSVSTGHNLPIAHSSPHNFTKGWTQVNGFKIRLGAVLTIGDEIQIYVPYNLTLVKGIIADDKQWCNKRSLRIYDGESGNDQYSLYSSDFISPFFGDDPNARAIFKVSVTHPSRPLSSLNRFVALSNTGIEETTKVGGKKIWFTDHFQTSPPLQLDQVAVVILRGPFRNDTVCENSPTSAVNRCVNVWKRSTISEDGNKNNGTKAFPKSTLKAVEIMKVLHLYESILNGTYYPLDKLDYVDLPEFGDACSTVGLITCHMARKEHFNLKSYEYGLLSRQLVKQFVGEIIENLSPDSWVYPLENHITRWITPNYDQGERSVFIGYYENTSPNPLELMEDAFTPKLLRSAVGNFYLPKWSWRAARTMDLYKALQQAINFHNATNLLPVKREDDEVVSIRDIVKPWLKCRSAYKGQLFVRRAAYDDSSIAITFSNPSEYCNCDWDVSSNLTRSLWVPVNILTQAGETHRWIRLNCSSSIESTTVFSSDEINTTTWLIVNPKSSVFLGVGYDDNLLFNIVHQLNVNHTAIPENVRANLLGASRPRKSYERVDFLPIATYLRNEMSTYVWQSALGLVDGFVGDLFVKYKEAKSLGMRYYGSLMNSTITRIGVSPSEKDDDNIAYLRLKMIGLCSLFEVPVCLDYTKTQMDNWIKNPEEELHPFFNQKNSESSKQLYCAAIRADSEKDNAAPAFHFILDKLFSLNISNENQLDIARGMATGLTCVNNDTLLTRLLYDKRFLKGSPELQTFHLDTIPPEILKQRGSQMVDVIYEFWKTQLSVVDADINAIAYKIYYCFGILPVTLYKQEYHDVKIVSLMDYYIEKVQQQINKLDSSEGKEKLDFENRILEAKEYKAYMSLGPSNDEKHWALVAENMVKWLKNLHH